MSQNVTLDYSALESSNCCLDEVTIKKSGMGIANGLAQFKRDDYMYIQW